MVVTGQHWTGSLYKSIHQIGRNCQKHLWNLCCQSLWTILGHFSDIFSTFVWHFVDIPFVWAVQRFARYNAMAPRPALGKGNETLGWNCVVISLENSFGNDIGGNGMHVKKMDGSAGRFLHMLRPAVANKTLEMPENIIAHHVLSL